MRSNRRSNTTPELALRRELHRRGLRYRVDYRLAGTRRRADVAFVSRRLAIFVDGCFWHGCPVHGTTPVQNADYWIPKLAENRRRDEDTTARFEAAGWRVLRCWEHEDVHLIADRVEQILREVTRTSFTGDSHD